MPADGADPGDDEQGQTDEDLQLRLLMWRTEYPVAGEYRYRRQRRQPAVPEQRAQCRHDDGGEDELPNQLEQVHTLGGEAEQLAGEPVEHEDCRLLHVPDVDIEDRTAVHQTRHPEERRGVPMQRHRQLDQTEDDDQHQRGGPADAFDDVRLGVCRSGCKPPRRLGTPDVTLAYGDTQPPGHGEHCGHSSSVDGRLPREHAVRIWLNRRSCGSNRRTRSES